MPLHCYYTFIRHFLFCGIYGVILLVFTNCAIPTEASQKLKEGDYIYGRGSGHDFESAKQQALKDLISNLQVSIKYTMRNTLTEHDKQLQTNTTTNIFIESHIKDLPNIQVDTLQKSKNKTTTVSVKVKKETLAKHIASKLFYKKQTLHAMLKQCSSLSLKQYAKFEHTFKEILHDSSLLATLSNTSHYDDEILVFQNTLASMPSYKIVWNNDALSQNHILKEIIQKELSKFISITTQAKRTLSITITHNGTVDIMLNFYDCKDTLENALHINTYLHYSSIANNQTRLSAILYKKIQQALEAN